MTNTIPNVPRELKPCPFCGDIPSENSHALTDGGFKYGAIQCGCGALGPDVRTEYKDWPHWRDAASAAWNERALLSAPSPAGVDGLEVLAWLCEWMGDKCGGVYSGLSKTSLEGLRRSQGEDVLIVSDEPLCRLSDAQAIIDGLQGEVEQIGNELVETELRALKFYHQIGAHVGLYRELRTERDQQAQRIGELEGLLRAESARVDFLDAYIVTADAPDTGKVAMLADSGTLRECIDFALPAGKEGE